MIPMSSWPGDDQNGVCTVSPGSAQDQVGACGRQAVFCREGVWWGGQSPSQKMTPLTTRGRCHRCPSITSRNSRCFFALHCPYFYTRTGRIPTDSSIHGTHSSLQSSSPSGQGKNSVHLTGASPSLVNTLPSVDGVTAAQPGRRSPLFAALVAGAIALCPRTERKNSEGLSYLVLRWYDASQSGTVAFKCPGSPRLTVCCLCPHHCLKGVFRDMTVMGVTRRGSTNSAGDWAELNRHLSSDE